MNLREALLDSVLFDITRVRRLDRRTFGASVYRVAIIEGDGIGPEISRATRRVIAATGVDVEWVPVEAGEETYHRTGTPLPAKSCEVLQSTDAVLKGPLSTPRNEYSSPNIAARRAIAGHVNVRYFVHPTEVFDNWLTGLTLVREITEDVYNGPSAMIGEDAAIAVKVATRFCSERVARFAFEFARENVVSRVTVAHKAGTLKHTDGLFLEAAQVVGRDYPEIRGDDELIDSLVYRLILYPDEFRVIVAPFQYGDILTGVCAALVGGLGVVPGATYGDAVAMFEPGHGSAPKYSGMDVANPIAMMLSGCLLLDYIGEHEAGANIRMAIAEVTREGRNLTRDLGGNAGTTSITDNIIDVLQ